MAGRMDTGVLHTAYDADPEKNPGCCLTRSQPYPCPLPIKDIIKREISCASMCCFPAGEPVLLKDTPRDVRLVEAQKAGKQGLLDTPLSISCTLIGV